jgi:hypothetical protein
MKGDRIQPAFTILAQKLADALPPIHLKQPANFLPGTKIQNALNNQIRISFELQVCEVIFLKMGPQSRRNRVQDIISPIVRHTQIVSFLRHIHYNHECLDALLPESPGYREAVVPVPHEIMLADLHQLNRRQGSLVHPGRGHAQPA